MEAILLTGLPCSGKSSFFKERLFETHVRISLELLKTRYRESLFLDACLSTDMPFVVDSNNATRAARSKYISAAKERRFKIVGFYFSESVEDCLIRNNERPEGERISRTELLTAARVMEPPTIDEGYDTLLQVSIRDREFVITDYVPDLSSQENSN